MPVYDAEKTEELAPPGSQNDQGMHPEHPKAQLDNSPNEELLDSPVGSWWARRKQNENEAQDAASLISQEERPESDYGNGALGDIQERLGLGFTGGGSQKSQFLTKSFGSNSKTRKRLAIAVAAGGAAGGGAILAFFLMLPLKVESFVNMIEGRAMASTQSAMQKAMGNAYSHYVGRYVMGALGTPGCRTTVDPGCVVVVRGANPVAKMYQAWSQGKLQQELASKHGIVIGKDAKTNKFYMSIKGQQIGNDEQFRKLQKGEISLFDLDSKEVSRSEIRRTLNTALKEGTFWDRTYKRYQYGKLLEKRYHIKRCLIACDKRDSFNESKEAKVLAGKLWVVQKVSGLAGESYGLIIDCMLDPGYCDTKLSASTEPGQEPTSRFQRELDSKLTAYIAGPGRESLATLVARAKDINELGFSGYYTREVARKLGEKLGISGAGELTEKAITKAVPVIGWASFLFDLKLFAQNAPDFIGSVRYQTAAATAVSTFAMYQSTAAEMKSSHIDLTLLGSVADTLSDKQDMASHPLYNNYLGGAIASDKLTNLFGLFSGQASALASTPVAFKCDDGNPVPQGRQSCLEEDLSYAGVLVEGAQAAQNTPAYEAIKTINVPIDAVIKPINEAYKAAAGAVGGIIYAPIDKSCSAIPPCASYRDAAGEKVAEIMKAGIDEVVPNQFKNLSGGRMLPISVAGAEVGFEKAAMLKLGAAPISNAAYMEIQRQHASDELADFQEKSFFARLVDTKTPYSLTSRVALSLPARNSVAPLGVASIFSSPLTSLSTAFSSLTPSSQTNALVTGSSSAVGIIHNGYSSAGIPGDPEQYWEAHCAARDFEQEFLDRMVQDPISGEAIATVNEPCLLLRGMSESGGGMFDASLLPSGSASTSGSTGTSASSTINSGELFKESASVGCAPGTRDLGLQDGYSSGQKVIIRVCAIPGFKSSAYESGAESEYAIQGADGDVIVNSRVSGAWLSLYSAAKTSGVTLSATSGFRTMKKQEALWIEFKKDSRRAAEPGYSPHQTGLAIDFATIRNVNLGAQSCSVRVTEPGNVYWEWLEKNAARFGFKQYSAEAWHWDPLQKSNRCGGGG